MPLAAAPERPVKFKHQVIYHCARGLMALLQALPYEKVGRLGLLFGSVVFALSEREAAKTLRNLKTAYGDDLTSAERLRLARRVWRNFGRNIFEAVHWLRWTTERIRSQVAVVYGEEELKAAFARGKGVFVVSAHLGNWELLASHVSGLGPTSGLAQNLYDPRFDSLVTDFRVKNLGLVQMIKRGFALRGILEALGQGHFMMALVDQDTGKDGVFVPFYGKMAWTQSGVARIAQRTGASLVPAFMVRGRDGRYEMHVEKAILVPAEGDKEKNVLEAVTDLTRTIEKYVREYPDQWVWMHDRWKTRPDDENKV
ncbi:MAG TPA: lysophospholipid acyltransferase family protein [bacterium]|nr:lysophospholipid acyltransferase family protein [bacterium]